MNPNQNVPGTDGSPDAQSVPGMQNMSNINGTTGTPSAMPHASGVAVANSQKKSNGMLIGMILFALLAAGGIGFGVWAYLDGNAQKDSLDKQITALKEQNSTLMEQIGDTTEEDNDDTVDTDTGSDVNTADYIYVGEWGLKIKIPKGLASVSYSFSQGGDYTSIRVWGVDCSEGGRCQYFPEFADMNKNTDGMGNVYRYPKGKEIPLASPPSLIFSDDSFDYYSYHLQALYSAVDSDSTESEWESNSVGLIWNALTDKSSFSKI